MSHITTYKVKISDIDIFKQTLEELQQEGILNFEWYGEETKHKKHGYWFQLDCLAHASCITDDGDLSYSYDSDPRYNRNATKVVPALEGLMQRYYVNKLLFEGRRQGWQANITKESNGEVTLKLYQ